MKSIIYLLSLITIIGYGSSSKKEETPQISHNVELTTQNKSYFTNDKIIINFKNMSENDNDWIGIFKKNSKNEFKNIIQRRDTNGLKNGKFIFDPIKEIGSYEARAFFKDSLKLEASISFDIVSKNSKKFIMYEDAENKISSNWRQISGSYPPLRAKNGFKSRGALVLTPEWIDNYRNISEYQLDMNNSNQKILEMDMGGLKDYLLPNVHQKGFIQHYKVGIRVTTSDGERGMIWDSFFNHGGVEPFKDGKWLSYPSPVEHVRGFENIPSLPIDKWVHFRVDVEEELHKLEPSNKIISIDTFFATGGFLDNIKLSN